VNFDPHGIIKFISGSSAHDSQQPIYIKHRTQRNSIKHEKKKRKRNNNNNNKGTLKTRNAEAQSSGRYYTPIIIK